MGDKRVRTYGIVGLVLVLAGLGLWYGRLRGPDDTMGPPILSVSAHGVAHQTLAIGLADGAEEYLFTGIFDVAVGRNGEMVVTDTRGRSVRIFDRNGQFVRYVGRDGDGPGEHREPTRVAITDDGVIGVCDRRGITVFEQEGRALRASIAMPARRGFCRVVPASSGAMIVSGEPSSPPERWTHLLSPSGTVTDSFPTPAARLVINPDTLGWVFVYSPYMISEWRSDGSRIHVWTADPVIEVDRAPRAPPGESAVSQVRLDIERVPVHPDLRREIIAAIQPTIDRGGGYSETADEIAERLKPAIAS
jgi:hypothetical protein